MNVSIDWGQILTAVLVIVLPPLAGVGAAGLFAFFKAQWALAKMAQPDLCNALEEAASLAVKAAEQSKLAKLIEDKKEYAVSVAEAFLVAKGVKVDLHVISAAVEKAVGDIFPHDEKPAEPQQ